jgi:hypothetical protein
MAYIKNQNKGNLTLYFQNKIGVTVPRFQSMLFRILYFRRLSGRDSTTVIYTRERIVTTRLRWYRYSQNPWITRFFKTFTLQPYPIWIHIITRWPIPASPKVVFPGSWNPLIRSQMPGPGKVAICSRDFRLSRFVINNEKQQVFCKVACIL